VSYVETPTPEFNAAFLAAQRDMQAPRFDGRNPHFNSKFATLAEVTRVAKAALNAHDLTLSQPVTGNDEGFLGIATVVAGHGMSVNFGTVWLRSPDDPQKLGAALTYLRRFGLASALALVADEDDDGETAGTKDTTPERVASSPAPAPASSPETSPAVTRPAVPEKPAGREAVQKWTRASVGLAAKKAGIGPGVLIAKKTEMPGDPTSWGPDEWTAYAVALGLELA
jgi:hypothetical protein